MGCSLICTSTAKLWFLKFLWFVFLLLLVIYPYFCSQNWHFCLDFHNTLPCLFLREKREIKVVSVNEEKRDWRAEELRNWFSIYTIPFFSIKQLCMESLFLPFFLYSQYLCSSKHFHWDYFHLRDEQCGSDKHHLQPQIWQHSKKSCDAILFCLSSSLNSCIPSRITKKSSTILMGKAIQIDGKH